MELLWDPACVRTFLLLFPSPLYYFSVTLIPSQCAKSVTIYRILLSVLLSQYFILFDCVASPPLLVPSRSHVEQTREYWIYSNSFRTVLLKSATKQLSPAVGGP